MTMRPHDRRALLAVFALVAHAGLARAVPPSRIEVSSPRVRLADVIRRCPAALADVDLGPAPMPGGSRILDRAQIAEALRARGLDAPAHLPEAVRVVRRTEALTPARLEQLTREALTQLPRGAELAAVRAPRGIEVPAGWTALRAEIARPPRRTGSLATTAMVTFLDHDTVLARVAVPIELTLGPDAARPDLARGAPVTLLVRQGLVDVRVSAAAGADADVGDTLPVMLRPSGRALRARLLEPDVALALEGP